jgi:hypothetical protein
MVLVTRTSQGNVCGYWSGHSIKERWKIWNQKLEKEKNTKSSGQRKKVPRNVQGIYHESSVAMHDAHEGCGEGLVRSAEKRPA